MAGFKEIVVGQMMIGRGIGRVDEWKSCRVARWTTRRVSRG